MPNSIFVIVLLVGTLFAIAAADFRADALKLTNQLRAKHGALPLKQDAQADKVAQAHAEKLAKMNQMMHSSNRKYGENLYATWGFGGSSNAKPTDAEKSETALQAVNYWYDEIKDYDFNNPEFAMNTAHFTQVVWKGTKAVGLGVASVNGNTYVVANYLPPGNMMGSFPQNVSPPK